MTIDEDTIYMSEDLQEKADPQSLLHGTVPSSQTAASRNGAPFNPSLFLQNTRTVPTVSSTETVSSIGYLPLPERNLYFTAVLEGKVGDKALSFAASISKVIHAPTSLILYLDLGNEDYYSLLDAGPFSVEFQEIKLVNPLGNQVMLAENVKVHRLEANLKDATLVEVAFEFMLQM